MFQRLNLGRFDRLARAGFGLVVVVHYGLGYEVFGWLIPLGIFCLASAAMGSCPIYALAGRSSRRRRLPAR